MVGHNLHFLHHVLFHFCQGNPAFWQLFPGFGAVESVPALSALKLRFLLVVVYLSRYNFLRGIRSDEEHFVSANNGGSITLRVV